MRISGRVTARGQAGAADVTVVAYLELGSPDGTSYRTTSGPDGSYSLDVPAGTYNLVARAPGSRYQAVRWHVQAATTVNLDLIPAGGIRGTVSAPGNPDLTGGTVFAPGTDLVAKTDASGSFAFIQVPAATYDLIAQVPGYALAKVSGVAVPAGGTVQATAISLGALAAVTGVLKGKALLNGATSSEGIEVTATGDGLSRTTTTAEDGSYSLGDLPPVFIWLGFSKAGYAGFNALVPVPAGTSDLPDVRLYVLATPTPMPTPTPVPTLTPIMPLVPAAIGNPAPDDSGDPAVHHDYLVEKKTLGGPSVISTFVWVPVFTAYQLINPFAAGYVAPVGAWVKDRPTQGTQKVGWAAETFGGFNAAKFEASRSDADPGGPTSGAGATAGTSAFLKVARYCVPWGKLTWDGAATASASFLPPHSHLMRDDEWTALAVWAMINGNAVTGNNNYLKDADDSAVEFIEDPTYTVGTSDRALTGSATSSLWTAGENKSTHTGTTAGVHDLNGNVTEWTLNVGAASGSSNYTLLDPSTQATIDLGFRVGLRVGNGVYAIRGLATDARWRRFGLPGAVDDGAGDSLFGNDAIGWPYPMQIDFKALRGAGWSDGRLAGLWQISISETGWREIDYCGFRPALVFK